jgi:EAL domain-containing protein (putative c-di-GMP-specific phosphodiesterase class I)
LVLAQIREPHVLGGEHLLAPASVGFAVFPRDADHVGELLAMADLAMQRAKTQGGDRVAQADAERDAEAHAARVLEQDLRLAVQNRQLRVWLQPQARASDLAPVGFEALVRWQHPVHGLVPPDRFIPIAEASGLIHGIGAWVLRESLRQAASWPHPLRIAVNVSPLQLQNGDLPAQVRGALEASSLLPERLEIEITESTLVEQGDAVLEQLHGIQALGVRISLDDFGAGYSSLGTLRAFPFDKLKMDRSFLRELETSQEAKSVVSAVLALGRALRMSVVAEGVQTLPQLEFLRTAGCDLLQGYLLGAPASADRFASITEHGQFDEHVAAKMAGRAPPMDEAEPELAELGWDPPGGWEASEAAASSVVGQLEPPAPMPNKRQTRAASPARGAKPAVSAKAPKPPAKDGRQKASGPKPRSRARQSAIVLRVVSERLDASEVPPAQSEEGQQQERREGDAVAHAVDGRARQKARPAVAPGAQKGRGQQRGGQGPAEVPDVDGRQDRAQLDVAPAHQPKAPRPPQREKPNARLEGEEGQRRVAPQDPSQQDERPAGQDGGIGNASAPQVAQGGRPAPGRQRQQPEKHSARAPSSTATSRIGPKAAAPQQPVRGTTAMTQGRK